MPARAPALPGKARATRGLVRGHPCPKSPSSPPSHNPMPARAPALPGRARATRGLVRGHPCPHCPSSRHPTHNPMPARAPALPGKARATRGLVRGHPCPKSPSSHHPTTIPRRRGCRRSHGRLAPHEVWPAGILARILRASPIAHPNRGWVLLDNWALMQHGGRRQTSFTCQTREVRAGKDARGPQSLCRQAVPLRHATPDSRRNRSYDHGIRSVVRVSARQGTLYGYN